MPFIFGVFSIDAIFISFYVPFIWWFTCSYGTRPVYDSVILNDIVFTYRVTFVTACHRLFLLTRNTRQYFTDEVALRSLNPLKEYYIIFIHIILLAGIFFDYIVTKWLAINTYGGFDEPNHRLGVHYLPVHLRYAFIKIQ